MPDGDFLIVGDGSFGLGPDGSFVLKGGSNCGCCGSSRHPCDENLPNEYNALLLTFSGVQVCTTFVPNFNLNLPYTLIRNFGELNPTIVFYLTESNGPYGTYVGNTITSRSFFLGRIGTFPNYLIGVFATVSGVAGSTPFTRYWFRSQYVLCGNPYPTILANSNVCGSPPESPGIGRLGQVVIG